MAYAHGLVLQVRHLAPEQILREDHAAGPELATTLSGIILEKEWGVEKTREINGCGRRRVWSCRRNEVFRDA